jgi:hypothetical protein
LSQRRSIGRPTVSAEVRNVDQTDGPCQSAMGRASHPWGIAKSRPRTRICEKSHGCFLCYASLGSFCAKSD